MEVFFKVAPRNFDYTAPAELFLTRTRKRAGYRYRRFGTAAEAIRFAEEIPPPLLVGAYLQVGDERFSSGQIHELYESAAYPLDRGE